MDLQSLLRKAHHLRMGTRLRIMHRQSGEVRSPQRGAGMNFEQVRQYQAGDDVRIIDWNVSARMQDTYVKEFRQEQELTCMLLVDMSASGWFGTDHAIKRYIAYEMAAVLGFSCLREQHRMGLIGYTAEPGCYVAPGKGRRHLVQMLQTMLSHTPTDKGTRLAEAVKLLNRVQRGKALVVVVSDFLDDSYPQAALQALRRHELVCIRLFHPGEQPTALPGLLPLADVERTGFSWSLKSVFQAFSPAASHLDKVDAALKHFCGTHGIRYAAQDVTQPYISTLEQLFGEKR